MFFHSWRMLCGWLAILGLGNIPENNMLDDPQDWHMVRRGKSIASNSSK